MGQEDQIVALPHVQGVDHGAVEGFPDFPVLQPGLPEGGEKAVLVAVRHLGGGEHHVDEVLPQGSGKGLFQEA